MASASSIQAPPTATATSPEARRAGHRTDIQVLRGIAVLAVLLYHLWPASFPGGYVGVDVFFVISGFLITDHILREIESTGRLRLGRFWARRARRLLPSALLVAAASIAGTLLFAPTTYWPQFLKEIAASVLYVENWALALDAVDYLAAENAASPVQHYWTLSVEEQFYLVWPLLAVGVTLFATRVEAKLRVVLGLAVGLILGVSLVWSAILVSSGSSFSYFGTHVRAWEFATGALLAIGAARLGLARRVPRAVSWAGVTMVLASVMVFSSSTPFPGFAALLPVVGAALVVAADSDGTAWSVGAVGRSAGAEWLGDISYAAYLWHWPLIIFAAYARGTHPGTRLLLVILALTGLLAWLTTRLVEEPLRRTPLRTRRDVALTLTVALIAMAATAGPALVLWRTQVAAAAAEVDRAIEAAGSRAGARVNQDECAAEEPPEELLPDPGSAVSDTGVVYPEGCITATGGEEIRDCTYGVPDAELRVALIGDSHATTWFPALEVIARERGWRLDTFLKSACPESAAVKQNDVVEAFESCQVWNAEMATGKHIERPYDLVFVAYSAGGDSYLWTGSSRHGRSTSTAAARSS
jgi:peptidoglycan/LPS O-acetylase OafA/YrhL